MANERRMSTKPLSFEPGRSAVTPMVADQASPTDQTFAGIQAQPEEVQSPFGQTDLKGVLVYLAKKEAIALKVYAAENSTSIQRLGVEAFAALFAKLGINGGTLTKVRANRKNGAEL